MSALADELAYASAEDEPAEENRTELPQQEENQLDQVEQQQQQEQPLEEEEEQQPEANDDGGCPGDIELAGSGSECGVLSASRKVPLDDGPHQSCADGIEDGGCPDCCAYPLGVVDGACDARGDERGEASEREQCGEHGARADKAGG